MEDARDGIGAKAASGHHDHRQRYADEDHANPTQTMKPNRLPIVGAILLALFLAGCAGTPKAKAYQFRSAYTATLTAIDQLAVSGKLSPAQAKQVQHLRPIGDAAESAVLANLDGGSAFNAALNAAQSVLNQLIAIQARATKGQ